MCIHISITPEQVPRHYLDKNPASPYGHQHMPAQSPGKLLRHAACAILWDSQPHLQMNHPVCQEVEDLVEFIASPYSAHEPSDIKENYFNNILSIANDADTDDKQSE